MTIEARDDKGLNIYWDYDAAQLNHKAVSGYEVVKNIRSAVNIFGAIQSFRIYHDSSNQSLSDLCSELCSSGVTLVDCPSNGRKEAATKMMIVDIIAYTWDHPAPRTIIVVSGDRDLAYMIGILRMRKYEVILMSPKGTHRSLTSQASVNLDWTTDGRRMDIDDPRGPQPSSQPISPHPPPSPHLFPPPHLPSPSLPLPATNGSFFHHPKTNFLSKAHEIDQPSVQVQGMPTARGCHRRPTFSHRYEPDRFDVFGGLGDSFPSPSIPNGMFGLGSGRPQSRGSARQVRSDSAPPGIISTHSPASPPDSNGFGRVPSSAKGKQRDFPITEPEDIGPQSPLTAKMPEGPQMAEGFFTSMHSSSAKIPTTSLTTGASTRSSSQDSTFSVIQFPLSSTLTSVNIDSENATEKGKGPVTVVVVPQEFTPTPPKIPLVHETEKVSDSTASPRKEEVPLIKDSHRAGLFVQPQLSKSFQPSPAPSLQSQKATPPKKTDLNARAGPSSTPSAQGSAPSRTQVPPNFQVLVDTLRQHGGSCTHLSLPALLLSRDPGVYKKAQVSKYTKYIEAAMTAGLVRKGDKINKGLCICLTEDYA